MHNPHRGRDILFVLKQTLEKKKTKKSPNSACPVFKKKNKMKRKKNGISGDVTSFVTVFLSKIGQFAINVFPLLVARPQGQLATRWLREETVVIDRRAITGSLPNLLVI